MATMYPPASRLVRSRAVLPIVLSVSWCVAPPARGAEPRPLPEAMLTESATDVDAREAGELEWEANASVFGAHRGGARVTATSLELEWRALREVGFRVEPLFESATDGSESENNLGFAGAVAFGLFHDFARDAHVQLEILGHTVDRATHDFEPSDAELPAAADLVTAIRRRRFTLRGTVGAEAFGTSAHAPLHTDLALLTGLREDERYGFAALEVRADFARAAPFVVAPEIVADASALGLPLRLGTSLPFNVGARATAASFGVLIRLTLLTEREARLVR